ncbi:MAG: TrkH family potassium uptake protein [Rhodospirillales bacterium]|nr:TrkH family potassium uptake protein [Rhodospirillales bacterium]
MAPWIVIAIALSGAISFSLYDLARQRGWRELPNDPGLRCLVITLALITVLLTLAMGLSGHYDWSAVIRDAPLLAASAQTTAGFSTLPISDLDPASKAITMLAMFIGGDAGSTAGGIKIIRWLLVLQLIGLTIVQTALPGRTVTSLRLYGQTFDDRLLQHTFAVILLFIVVIALSWFAFLTYGYAPLDSLFDVVSATATTGLSSGVTATDLPTPLKLVLCLDMLMGRVEVLAVLAFLYPANWFGKKAAMI